jgi:hypothetical protein
MARSGGTYTAPSNSFNPAVEGETIDEAAWNDTLDDLEAALTESTYTGGLGSTDNRLVRTDGTDTKKIQGTGITVDDSNNVTGVVALSATTIELGHASDTTLARSGAGDVTIEGNAVYRAGGTDVALADGGTGASLADPGADRVLFWDDSAGATTWLTVGTGLSITDTTLAVSGAGTGDVLGPASSVDGELALFDSTTGKLLKRATTTGLLKGASGVLSAASAGTDYYAPGGTDVALADGGTGASLTDPNADRIMFWDDSAGGVTWLEVGSGLTLTDTTLTVAGAGTGDVIGPNSATDNAIVRFDATTGKLIQDSAVTIDDTTGKLTGARFGNTGLKVEDTNASHLLTIAPGSDLSADRTLTLTTGDADRTLTLSANLTVSNALTLAGTDSTTMTFPPATASVGYLDIPQNSQSAAYTLVLADAGKHLLHPSSDNNARTFTIPANGSVAYPVGTAITFINAANTLTIAITTDTMYLAGASNTTGSRTLAAYGLATAIKIASTTWVISGTNLT